MDCLSIPQCSDIQLHKITIMYKITAMHIFSCSNFPIFLVSGLQHIRIRSCILQAIIQIMDIIDLITQITSEIQIQI